MPKKIESIETLKKESSRGAEFLICLKGCLRSSTYISWDEKTQRFVIWNYIDDTEHVLTKAQLMDGDYTNIGYAMTKGALFKDD